MTTKPQRTALSKKMRRYVLEFLGERDGQGWACYYCKQPLRPYGENGHYNSPALEHAIPLARGGNNERANLRLACVACNIAKGTKTEDEFSPPELREIREMLKDFAAEIDTLRKARIQDAQIQNEQAEGTIRKIAANLPRIIHEQIRIGITKRSFDMLRNGEIDADSVESQMLHMLNNPEPTDPDYFLRKLDAITPPPSAPTVEGGGQLDTGAVQQRANRLKKSTW